MIFHDINDDIPIPGRNKRKTTVDQLTLGAWGQRPVAILFTKNLHLQVCHVQETILGANWANSTG